MVTAYQGTIHNGQVHFDGQANLPEGTQVIVVVVGDDSPDRTLTLDTILELPLVGMWADREDITDGAEFARQLRERASKRSS